MAERTSWLAIRAGWEVVDSAGAVIGEVTSVVGDPDSDIFDGLRFETADGDERYARGEKVGDIYEGRVAVHAELEDMGDPEDEAPGGMEVNRDREAGL